ncbi:MAG: SET domain-containing protein-lysine N-methyltransferase [Ectothiorhodospiraceae bacterium]|nr:SET domain-containing protein-lysine N-methyltransferase [Ectothiorhodospiraceae bacterium]
MAKKTASKTKKSPVNNTIKKAVKKTVEKMSATYADDSPIHGKGLFASRRITKGEVLGTVSGFWTKRNGPYVLWVEEDKGFRVECDFRFINHNPKPNAAYYDTLEVCALRSIAKGEEITHDYGLDGEFE